MDDVFLLKLSNQSTHIMKKILPLLLLLTCTVFISIAQNNIGINTTTPDSSAVLHIEASDKGLLIPRMDAAARLAISTPAEGLLVFDNSTNSFWFYDGLAWKEITPEDADNNPGNELQSLAEVLVQGSSAADTRIQNLQDPVDGQDAATKAYVDAAMANAMNAAAQSFGVTYADQSGAQFLIDAMGYDIPQLVAAGVDTAALIAGGLLEDLLAGGADYAQLKDATNVTAADFVQGGAEFDSLQAVGYTIPELFHAGVHVSRFLFAGFTLTDLLAAGVGIVDLVQGGVDPADFNGLDYLGGMIAWVDPSGLDSLIAGAQDESGFYVWQDAVNQCAGLPMVGSASWHLPTQDELNLLWENLADPDGDDYCGGLNDPNNIGGFGAYFYWSSTEIGSSVAYNQGFLEGQQTLVLKSNLGRCRCVLR